MTGRSLRRRVLPMLSLLQRRLLRPQSPVRPLLLLWLLAQLSGCVTNPPDLAEFIRDEEKRWPALLRDYDVLTGGDKAVSIALEADGRWAAGVADQQPGLMPAIGVARARCEHERKQRGLTAACELVRLNGSVIPHGRTLRAQARMNDLAQPTLLWQMQGGASSMVLGGSVHVFKPSLMPLPPAFDAAYVAADTLVLEIDLQGAPKRNAAAGATSTGTVPPGPALAEVLDADTLARAQHYAQRFGIDWARLSHLRPTELMIEYALGLLITRGLDAAAGIDRYFANAAERDLKPVLAVESFATQMQALHSASTRSVQMQLSEELNPDHAGGELDSLVRAWLTADLTRFEQLRAGTAVTDDGTPYSQVLLDQRNRGMAKSLADLLSAPGKRYFVLIGAAHLTGDDSVLALLANAGYAAVQLNRAGEPLRRQGRR